MRERRTFVCDHCGFESTNRDEVAACEAHPVKRLRLKPGTIVAGVGHEIGSWALRAGRSDPNWLAMDQQQKIWAKWIVVATVLEKDVAPRYVVPGPLLHREVLLLYTPCHPAYGECGGPAYVWCPDAPPLSFGEITPGQLRDLQERLRWKRPHLI